VLAMSWRLPSPALLPYTTLFRSLAVVLAGVAGAAWYALQPRGLGEGFASGNGRIEATEIDVATKLGGRIASIDVSEGDFVLPGQDRKSTRLNSSHVKISYAVFCL